jgi:hypothetical protein
LLADRNQRFFSLCRLDQLIVSIREELGTADPPNDDLPF